MVNMFLEQAPWFPQRERSRQWVVETYKKGREAFKTSVNESYKKVEDFCHIEEKTEDKQAIHHPP